jgi:hypothetical protein
VKLETGYYPDNNGRNGNRAATDARRRTFGCDRRFTGAPPRQPASTLIWRPMRRVFPANIHYLGMARSARSKVSMWMS